MLSARAALYRDVVEEWEVDAESRRIARRRLSQTERWIRRFDPERTRPSLRLGVTRIRAHLREPRSWLAAVPPEVEELLARTTELSGMRSAPTS